MKLLVKAAIRNSKHLSLAIIMLISLWSLTIANQLEVFSLGIMANTGSDFFTMFGQRKHGRIHTAEKVELSEVVRKWKDLDQDEKGYVTKKDAASYLMKKKDANLINHIFRKIQTKLNIESNFKALLSILLIVACFKALCLFFARYFPQILSIRVTRDLRQQYFEHIQSLPLSFYHDYDLGSLTARVVGDAGQIASSLNSLLVNYLQMPFTALGCLVACFFLSWELSLIIFVGVPLVVIPILALTKKIRKVNRQIQKNQETFTSVLLDFLSGIHTIKIFTMEHFSLKKYKEQNDRMAKLESKSAKYSLLTRPILHTITTMCLVAVVLFGLYTLHMTLAQLLVFCGVLHQFYEPVKKFAEENANIQKGLIAAERMFEVLNIAPKIQDQKGAKKFQTFKHSIVFEDVWFKYKDAWVLKGLSFSVEKGQTVAIVGSTGAGKSTIVQLLPRLYDIQKGRILIDDIPIEEFTQKSLRENISFVPQKPFLFFDTVAENISFGMGFSHDEIQTAAKKAHAHDFISQLPEQYNTHLAETGKDLSGGQQQRLAIARALVKRAPILILDEATSALDSLSENRIKMAIEGLHNEKTQIIIAHRLSTIEHADKIIFLDDGTKLAEGTKQELLDTCLPFRAMWEAYQNQAVRQEV